jgi:hypothetical protein
LKRKEHADEDQKEMTPFHSYSSQIYEKKKREKTTTFHDKIVLLAFIFDFKYFN